MDGKNIKWCALQPLTGGAFFGTRDAVGYNAEFILSYPGFDSTVQKDGKIIRSGNEYHLLKYLEKKDESVPYYQFDRKPFQNDNDLNPKILHNGVIVEHPDYSNMDLVVAVPVCSGLSTATNATTEVRETKNCNMVYLAKYALNVIKPKIYIFENAPTLFTSAGAKVRSTLESIARDANYSIAYYRTDSMLHDNCQRRPRTFVYFFRQCDNHRGVPVLGYENKTITARDLLSRIPKNATQQVAVPMNAIMRSLLDYAKHKFGDSWRSHIRTNSIIEDLVKDNTLKEYQDFVNSSNYSDSDKRRINDYVNHIHEKLSDDKGFWRVSPIVIKHDGMPTAMYKNIEGVLHYKEDRFYTLREWMTSMGMPFDFELQCDFPCNCYKQIGQNVPARTMQFIAGEAVRILNNWDSCDRINANVVFINNVKQTVIPVAD